MAKTSRRCGSALCLTVDDVNAAVEELRAKGAEIAIGPPTRTPACASPSFADQICRSFRAAGDAMRYTV